MIDIVRTKIIGYTMELNLKAKEFNVLCNKLEKLKEKGINPNDKKSLKIKELFAKNNREIIELNKKLHELQEDEQKILTDIFENKKDKQDISNNVKPEMDLIERKESIINIIINKIKKWINLFS